MAKCVLKDFEAGYILGPFPKTTYFIQFRNNPSSQPLYFVNVFTVPKTKHNQTVGRAVFDLRRSGYNAGIPDADAFVQLPQFPEIVNLLRNNTFANVIDLKNVYRQWTITPDSYTDFAYFIENYVVLLFFVALYILF